jgi:hypothetical protein
MASPETQFRPACGGIRPALASTFFLLFENGVGAFAFDFLKPV